MMLQPTMATGNRSQYLRRRNTRQRCDSRSTGESLYTDRTGTRVRAHTRESYTTDAWAHPCLGNTATYEKMPRRLSNIELKTMSARNQPRIERRIAQNLRIRTHETSRARMPKQQDWRPWFGGGLAVVGQWSQQWFGMVH